MPTLPSQGTAGGAWWDSQKQRAQWQSHLPKALGGAPPLSQSSAGFPRQLDPEREPLPELSWFKEVELGLGVPCRRQLSVQPCRAPQEHRPHLRSLSAQASCYQLSRFSLPLWPLRSPIASTALPVLPSSKLLASGGPHTPEAKKASLTGQRNTGPLPGPHPPMGPYRSCRVYRPPNTPRGRSVILFP